MLTRELYAVSAILGAGSAVAVLALWGDTTTASLIGGTLAITLRLASRKLGWHLPKPRIIGGQTA
ncbi:hypothetical protein [Leucobacter insecticola]|uniref:hypothetical protein n=1 Tax=Leucobacter insecticola TaxID=2714934 RepID=UPI001FCAE81E|nr:hypothetical protein [Leucobacter insecticola]